MASFISASSFECAHKTVKIFRKDFADTKHLKTSSLPNHFICNSFLRARPIIVPGKFKVFIHRTLDRFMFLSDLCYSLVRLSSSRYSPCAKPTKMLSYRPFA